MKKSFLQSIRLSNWSAVISANDESGVPARTKGAPPLFCEEKRLRVPLSKKRLLSGIKKKVWTTGYHNFPSARTHRVRAPAWSELALFRNLVVTSC